jgi:hypothetical protein
VKQESAQDSAMPSSKRLDSSPSGELQFALFAPGAMAFGFVFGLLQRYKSVQVGMCGISERDIEAGINRFLS